METPVEQVTDTAEEHSGGTLYFFRKLPSAFIYPFRRGGWAAIIGGAAFFGILWFLSKFAVRHGSRAGVIVGILFGLFAGGYLAAYMIKVLGSSAGGDDHVPDWPDMNDAWDDLIHPVVLLTGAAAVSFLPPVAYWAWHTWNGSDVDRTWLYSLVAIGMAYLPMGLVAVALFESLKCLNPVTILRAIVLTLPGYVAGATIFFASCYVSFIVQIAVSGLVPMIGPFLAGAVSLYFVTVEMRVLGLLYFAYSRKLKWFD